MVAPSMGSIKDKKAAPLLIDALKDSRMTVKLHSIKGLGRMKYKKGVAAISRLLRDESGGIRVNALYALIELGINRYSAKFKNAYLIHSGMYDRKRA